jgi:uncharacterized protein YbbC (DUF1343 family)
VPRRGHRAVRGARHDAAPQLDGARLARDLAALALPGVRFRPVVYTPTFHKYAGKPCGGVQLHVTHAGDFRPVRTGVAFLAACRLQAPVPWRVKAYEFVDRIAAIDLLAGGPWLREGIDAGASLDDLTARWPRDEGAFLEERQPYLLYD